MTELPPDTQVELVKRYGRAIAHMRRLSQRKRLGLALGAGVSLSAQLPSWNDLIVRLTREIEKRRVVPAPALSGEDTAHASTNSTESF